MTRRKAWDEQAQSKACIGKKGYTDEPSAQRSADRVAGRNWLAGRDSDMRAYRCVFCELWHVGHKRDRSAVPVQVEYVQMLDPKVRPASWTHDHGHEPFHTRHPEAWQLPRETWTEWRPQ